MTPEERQLAAMETIQRAANEIREKYGYLVKPTITQKQYGDMLQIEAQIALQPVQDWEQPEMIHE